jgi:disulfide bond formation protein DsbB
MSAQLYNRFLALLVLMGLAAVVALLFPPVRRAALGLGLGGSWRWMAFTVAALATGGSLIFSEVIGYEPCELCWYQRITMYPMVAIFGVDLFGNGSRTRRYALPLAVAGFCISVYHYILQLFPSAGEGVCGTGVPCSARYVEEFGFVSIPFMAGVAFALIIAILLALGRPNMTGEQADDG